MGEEGGDVARGRGDDASGRGEENEKRWPKRKKKKRMIEFVPDLRVNRIRTVEFDFCFV